MMVALALLAALGYWVSLRTHPFRRCRRCGGTGKRWGVIYFYAYRNCRACDGKGRRPRLGSRPAVDPAG